jgi:hypothetical protein
MSIITGLSVSARLMRMLLKKTKFKKFVSPESKAILIAIYNSAMLSLTTSLNVVNSAVPKA